MLEQIGEIPSATRPGTSYQVKAQRRSDGELFNWRCDCPAWRFSAGDCKHIRSIKQAAEMEDLYFEVD